MGQVDGKVAFISGAARGQGRSHALRLAEEGADIIAVDLCAQIPSVPYPMSTPEDLNETAALVEKLGRRIVVSQVDVRDERGLCQAFERGADALGTPDIVVANAGIAWMAAEESPDIWRDVIDVNLTGVMLTIESAIPAMLARNQGGSIIVIGSTSSLVGFGGSSRGTLAYTASKHGVIGLMRQYANNLASALIRVNAICPAGVNTPMITNDAMTQFLAQEPALAESLGNAMPVDMLDPEDVSSAVLWLASPSARYVTGVVLPVDAGFANKR